MRSLDLAGQVKRLGEQPFRFGGFADIYKGSLNGRDTMVGQTFESWICTDFPSTIGRSQSRQVFFRH
jgi:hypothetical protein